MLIDYSFTSCPLTYYYPITYYLMKLLPFALAALTAASSWAAEPFKTTTIENGQFAAGTTWYHMEISSSSLPLMNNGSASYMELTGTVAADDKYQWCFVGNETDGYQIYNKEAGPTKALTAPTTMSSGEGGTSYAVLMPVSDATSSMTNLWQLKAATSCSTGQTLTVENAYYLNEKGYSSNVLNNRDSKLAFWSGGYDNGSAIVISAVSTTMTVNLSTGTFTATNPSGTYASTWKSTAVNPQLTFSTSANNMSKSGTELQLASGQSGNSVYTLSAGELYKITGYSLTVKNANTTSAAVTLTIGSKTYNISNAEQTITVSGEDAASGQMTLSGDNHDVLVTNFTVDVARSYRIPEKQQNLFITNSSSAYPYRIPAIAKAHNGDLIAISDYRPCGKDIGYGEVDIKGRISTDNGQTWGTEFFIADGTGKTDSNGSVDCGFGDAAVVADSESDAILLISVCGKTIYAASSTTRQNPNRVARFYSYDNGKTWTKHEEITESIYTLFDESRLGPVQSLFFGSGRICQSRQVKVGSHYRLYAALCARPGGNRVVYSDDFGKTWASLGTIHTSPASAGDEPKCEELPDGRVILSSRTNGGRIFNIFTYTDVAKAEGAWGNATRSEASNNGCIAVGNATNGEIMIIPATRNSDGKHVYVALQSVPLGSGRANVGIYYKELASDADFSNPSTFSADWDGKHQASYMGSAYSTMIMQQNDSIAFLYEESTFGSDYTTVYKQYSLETITDGKYTYNKNVDRGAFVSGIVEQRYSNIEAPEVEAVGTVNADKIADLAGNLKSYLDAYKKNPTAQAYVDLVDGLTEGLYITIDPTQFYTLLNKGRSGKYMATSTTVDNISGTHGSYQSTTSKTAETAKFSFIAQADGTWKIYNAKSNTYVSPTQENYKYAFQVANESEAGTYLVTSSEDGWSTLVCTNPAGSKTALHLDGQNFVVAWDTSEDASIWRIQAVDLVDSIGEISTETSTQPAPAYYDLQGRRLHQIPAKGIYISSDRKKHLAK